MSHIVIIPGSLRAASYNKSASQALADIANTQENVSTEVLTLNNIPPFNEDLEDNVPAPVIELANKIKSADGVIISTPEYSSHTSGVLVNALNWLSRESTGKPLKNRTVAIMGATPGGLGTARSQSNLQSLLYAMGVQAAPNRMFISKAHEIFDASGNLTDEKTRERLTDFLGGYLEYLEN